MHYLYLPKILDQQLSARSHKKPRTKVISIPTQLRNYQQRRLICRRHAQHCSLYLQLVGNNTATAYKSLAYSLLLARV